MAKERDEKAITTRSEDYSQSYQDVVLRAELAAHSPVKGCMVIRPRGYAIWESIQPSSTAGSRRRATERLLPPVHPDELPPKEEEHVEGFAMRRVRIPSVVDAGGGGEELEEPLVVRPTIGDDHLADVHEVDHSRYRDLPLLINQWANVVRWENAHAPLPPHDGVPLAGGPHGPRHRGRGGSEKTFRMLDVYADFAENVMAVPVFTGEKTDEREVRRRGATYCIEAMMQDGKALQAGTSTTSARISPRRSTSSSRTRTDQMQYCWTTSGASPRGSSARSSWRTPTTRAWCSRPGLAPLDAVIVPIWASDEAGKAKVLEVARQLKERLCAAGLGVVLDDRDTVSPGFKYNEWELKGVPVRLEIGPRDVDGGVCVAVPRVPTRDLREGERRQKETIALDGAPEHLKDLLDDLQKALFTRALKFREDHSYTLDSYEQFKTDIEKGGFFWAHWCGSAACEAKVKDETKATIRCIPFDAKPEAGQCMVCGAPSERRVVFARAY